MAAHDNQADEPEELLARRAQRGDRTALGELFRRHQRRVYALVCRLVWREADAVELAQETFVRAIQSVARLDPARPVRPWLFGIAINVCRNFHRLGSRRELPGEAAADREPLWGPRVVGPEEQTRAREAAAVVAGHLAELSQDTRALLLLRIGEELTYAELREIFGAPEVVLKMRVHRAVARLRRLTEEELP
jgi:RNA polymerase sigma-70 factor (ECF subfamily)